MVSDDLRLQRHVRTRPAILHQLPPFPHPLLCRLEELAVSTAPQQRLQRLEGRLRIPSETNFDRIAQTNAARATEFEDLAIEHLRRALELWRRGSAGPDEVQLIQDEPAFHAGLRARPEFQELLRPLAP